METKKIGFVTNTMLINFSGIGEKIDYQPNRKKPPVG